MEIYCNTCDTVIDDNKLEEPFGLSGLEPACPHCQGNDFSDDLPEEEQSNNTILHEFEGQR